MILINSYFDFTDFDQQIKHYIDDTKYYELETDRQKVTNIYFQKNKAILQDDIFQLGSAKEISFF